jgi:hypothetical protein
MGNKDVDASIKRNAVGGKAGFYGMILECAHFLCLQ